MITEFEVEFLHVFDIGRRDFNQPCLLNELGSWDCVYVYLKKVIRNENFCSARE